MLSVQAIAVCSNTINNTIGEIVPFTSRVAKVFNHQSMKRLYSVQQLGLMAEIYPGASHNRWSHSLGVFAIIVKYYISILSDPNNPLIKIIINKEDIDHAFLAAILHDIGQTSVGHDLEAANKGLFNHISYTKNLVVENNNETISLHDVIKQYWGRDIDLDRIMNIIEHKSKLAIDHVASDCIDSSIDADKLDYIKRDSYYCGVSYGDGIDYSRIMNSLTVAENSDNQIKLAYYAKGRTAVSSLLLARAQLYGSVYWHHTFRCLHAMLFYATQAAFGGNSANFKYTISSNKSLDVEQLRKLYYNRVVLGKSWKASWAKLDIKNIDSKYSNNDNFFANDFSLDFIYRFTDENGKKLLNHLRNRTIFKRIFSKSLQGIETDLEKKCENRMEISKNIQKKLFDHIDSIKYSNPALNASEIGPIIVEEISKYQKEIDSDVVCILVDFPQKIRIPKSSWPIEISDHERKSQIQRGNEGVDGIVKASNDLAIEAAAIRIFAEPKFYSLITRFLTPYTIQSCIMEVIPELKG